MASKSTPRHSSSPKRTVQTRRAQQNLQCAPMGGGAPNPAEMQQRMGNRGTQAWLAEQAPVQKSQKKDQHVEMSGRKELAGEELLQAKFDPVQRQGPEEEEEVSQGKFSANETTAQAQGDQGNSQNRNGMPDPLKAGLEQLSGMDLSGVRVHKNSFKPAQLNALAYTQGQDIHVAPGQEKHLPHEGWHAVQQMQGRVQPTMQAKGMSINDDEGLEHEADVMGAKAAAQMKTPDSNANEAEPDEIEVPTIAGLYEQEADHVTETVMRRSEPVLLKDEERKVQTKAIQAKSLSGTIQAYPILAKAAGRHVQLREDPKVPVMIRFKGSVTIEEFKQIAMKQLFGGQVSGLEWTLTKKIYADPVKLLVAVSLIKRHRSQQNAGKGIETEQGSGVKGAAERKKDFADSASQGEKGEINQEIDRRYYATTGDKPGTKITNSKVDAGKRELWLQLRDEVLFQREYVKNLPPKVKKFIKESIYGRVLTAKDYEQLFRIGKMIENLPADISQDYLSKINSSTTDLSQFEASLHNHIEAQAKDQTVIEESLANSKKLAGLDEIYKKYRTWWSLIKSSSRPGVGLGGIVILRTAGELRTEIDAAVKQRGFTSVEDFEAFIKKFENSFAKHSQIIALNLIDKLRGTLYKEQQRYAEISELNTLLTLIKSGKTKEELAKTYPIFQEEELPDDKKIDLERLKKTSTGAELGTYLTAKANERQMDVGEARGHVAKDPNVIFKLSKLMPQFFLQQGIAQDSIHQMIIEDKLREDAILKLVVGIATAIAAIALAVISLGTAVPAIVAAGAAAAGFGLGAYMAYEEYKNYTLENNLADAGLANDPSLVWLIIAVVGAALDLAAAAKAINAIGKGTKAADAAKDIAALEKVLAEARKAGKIDAKISDAVISAAKARIGYAAASDNLGQILANSKGVKNFLDPQVYIELVKMARFKVQQGVTNFNHYLLEIRKMRKAAKMGDLSPEELLKVKQAWAEGRALAGLSDDALKGADALVKPVKEAVMKRITGDAKFAFTHTDEELRAVIAKGKAVGLSQKDIEHLVFASCRKDKPLNAIELMNQMDFYKYLRSRGFPSKFRNIKDFDDFKAFLTDEFTTLGVKTSDLRIQGSAVRSATAGDVDPAAMVSHAEFDDLIKRIYGTKLKENNAALDITKYSHDDLVKLSQRIEANPKSFNGVARSDFQFNFTKKILQPIPKKKAVYQAMDLGKMLEALQARFPHLNIDNFTIQVPGGVYDSYPFWQL